VGGGFGGEKKYHIASEDLAVTYGTSIDHEKNCQKGTGRDRDGQLSKKVAD